jgi:hypothetical protein
LSIFPPAVVQFDNRPQGGGQQRRGGLGSYREETSPLTQYAQSFSPHSTDA